MIRIRTALLVTCLPLVSSELFAQVDWPQLKQTQVGAGLTEPVYTTSARDGSGRLFIVEQPGRMRIVQSNSLLSQPFLDITNRVTNPPGSVFGLLSVAFSPGYSSNHQFYVYYSRTNDQATVISRFTVSGNPDVVDPATEQPLLIIPLGPCAATVLGGQVAFGPDGFLYISTGGEGPCPDLALGQAPDSLWGKILRIDVRGGTNGYAVPPSNPFVGNSAYKPEIWAMGLRNPWRFSFDRQTGDLYIGDVGQNLWEEIDFQSSSSTGGVNYGWSIMEGTSPNDVPDGFDLSTLALPIIEYPHTNVSGTSVTGGYVYRGPASARMDGLYFFGDFIGGKVWAAAHSGTNWLVQEIPLPKHFISSFGEDDSGRLYLVDFVFGKVYLLEDSGLAGPPVFSPPPGIVFNDTVTATSSSPGAVIHYTTNGATPVETDPVMSSNAPVTVTSGTTLSARAFRADLQPSTVTTGAYTLQVATPAFTPPHGPINNGTSLAITSITAGATIRYTLDGSDPTPGSALYPGPITISPTNIVSARAFKSGFSASAIQRVYFSGAMPLQHVALFGQFFSFSWLSETGRFYQPQVSSNLSTWTDTDSAQAGSGGTLSLTTPLSSGSRFFRVRVY